MRDSYYSEYFRIEDEHWWFVGRRQILLALLDRYLGRGTSTSTRKILDFGCGTGTMLGHLERYGSVRGLDADSQAVEFCRQRGLENVSKLEGSELPFEDRSFALVTALDVLEHIEDDGQAMREILRILEPGGLLLATVPAHPWMWGPHDEINQHFRRYTKPELRAGLIESGFSIDRLSYFNALLFAPIAAVRLARRLWDRPEQSDFEMGRMNGVLSRLFGLEAPWLARRDLPVGVSIAAIARPA